METGNEEEEGEEETALEKAMKAARTARNVLTALALEKASKTKNAQKAAQAHGTELGKALEQVKAILSGKTKGQTAVALRRCWPR